jgi:hypothetical protein
MKIAKTLALGAAALCVLALTLRADEPKEVTLKGTIVCAKCTLGEDLPDCLNAIQVKDKDSGKTLTYYIKDKAKGEDYHGKFCTNKGVSGSVTGVVSEDKGKKWITPSKDGVKLD